MPDFTPCWPGLVSSLHLESSERRALFRKRSVPSRRASLHLGPVYRATMLVRVVVRNEVGGGQASDAAALRGAAAVVRNRRHVRDAGDLDAERVERAHRGLAARAGALDAHLE